MGTWGERAFDNDTAADWAETLMNVDDLSVVEAALDKVDVLGHDYLEQDLACEALAAGEVLARLSGKTGYSNAYTETVDEWVASHKLQPPPSLLRRATAAIDRILGPGSELRELWDDTDEAANWRAAVSDLRGRLNS
jgi:hypothetical protein